MSDLSQGGAMSSELGQEITGFVKELKGFRADIEEKMQQQEHRMNILDRKNTQRGRSPLANAAESQSPHHGAFAAYLRKGDDSGLRGLAIEEKALNSFDSGFLAAPIVSDKVQVALGNSSSLRALASVVQIEAGAFEAIVETESLGSAWVREAVNDTESGAIARVMIELHELAATPKASQRLLDDAAFDVEGWISERIAERFVAAEAAAFIAGDGVDKPIGLLTATTDTIDSKRHDRIGLMTTASSTAVEADELIDLVYALPASHRSNGAFIINSKVASMLRKLRDTDGRFLWADSLAAGEPARLLGYPVMVSEDMPEPEAGGAAVLFGDFRAGYVIAERPELRVLRDPFSAKPNILFYATKRVGGALVDGRAIKRMNFA